MALFQRSWVFCSKSFNSKNYQQRPLVFFLFFKNLLPIHYFRSNRGIFTSFLIELLSRAGVGLSVVGIKVSTSNYQHVCSQRIFATLLLLGSKQFWSKSVFLLCHITSCTCLCCYLMLHTTTIFLALTIVSFTVKSNIWFFTHLTPSGGIIVPCIETIEENFEHLPLDYVIGR